MLGDRPDHLSYGDAKNHILCEAEQWACVSGKLRLPLSDVDLLLL